MPLAKVQGKIDQATFDLPSRLLDCVERKEMPRASTNEQGVNRATQAKALGVNPSTLSRYISEKTAMDMTARKVFRAAQYYDVSADYLLGFTKYKDHIRTSDDEIKRQVCDYTGLTEDTIDLLHEKCNDPLFMSALNYLVTNESFLRDIINYLLSSIYDDLCTDERYSCLPRVKQFSLNPEKNCFYDVIGALPQFKEQFYKRVSQSEQQKEMYIAKFAEISIDLNQIIQARYPGVQFEPGDTIESLSKKESEIIAQMEQWEDVGPDDDIPAPSDDLSLKYQQESDYLRHFLAI